MKKIHNIIFLFYYDNYLLLLMTWKLESLLWLLVSMSNLNVATIVIVPIIWNISKSNINKNIYDLSGLFILSQRRYVIISHMFVLVYRT